MILDIDPASATPPYEQIREQIAAMVDAGPLAVGTRLPSIRQLAGDLGLAPGTVARAYRELEAGGMVRSRVRHGTVVAGRSPGSEDATRARAHEAARDFVAQTRRLGMSSGDVLAAVRAELERDRAR